MGLSHSMCQELGTLLSIYCNVSVFSLWVEGHIPTVKALESLTCHSDAKFSAAR